MTQEEIDRIKRRFSKPETDAKPAGAPAAPKPAPPKPKGWMERAGEIALDVGKTIDTGLTRGVIGSPGMPADISKLGQLARDYIRSTNIGGPSQGTFEEVRAREDARREQGPAVWRPSNLQRFGSQAVLDAASQIPGNNLEYRPTTSAGQVAMPISEMAGGALVGGIAGGVRGAAPTIGNVVRQGVIPGAAVEGAKAGGVENPVALGAIGLGAGATAQAATTQSAARALGARTAGATPEQLAAAERLFQFAQQNNLPLSRGNALDMVTGGRTSASDIQRVIENQQSPTTREFYADSPQRVQAAGGRALDEIGPVSQQPSTIGPRIKEQMETRIEGTETAINDYTRPAYRAFQDEPLTSEEFARLLQDPLFMRQHQQSRRPGAALPHARHAARQRRGRRPHSPPLA